MDDKLYLNLILKIYINNNIILKDDKIKKFKKTLKKFIKHFNISYKTLYDKKFNTINFKKIININYIDYYNKFIKNKNHKYNLKYILENYIFKKSNNKNNYYFTLLIGEYINDNNPKKHNIIKYKRFLKLFIKHYNINYESLYKCKLNLKNKNEFDECFITNKKYNKFLLYVYETYLIN